ncbi:FAD binding domain-containing protein [Phthorimaea operculella]|nr:FAD binding domain-containing protein [Phthorimaea operculella]
MQCQHTNRSFYLEVRNEMDTKNMRNTLKPYNTFGLDVSVNKLVTAHSPEELLKAWQNANGTALILGEGSNILFLEDFKGTVILNRIMGLQVEDQKDAWLLHVSAGENWHNLVEYTLEHNMPGLENLAMIPGCAGSAPIQNIGAYGVEFKQVCQYVDCIELETGKAIRLNNEECQFGYRDSIFKHEYKNVYAITGIGLLLPKKWTPILFYGDLASIPTESITPKKVFDLICHMRLTKLPDPKVVGNAGSFFKNPIISQEAGESFLAEHPTAPKYKQGDGSVKLAAGWLIDQCGLKGYTIGGASVHDKQALVIVNQGNATSDNVVDVARFVRNTVGEKFHIWLEPEVRFIGQYGEVDALEILEQN